jgi:hypothetical protein
MPISSETTAVLGVGGAFGNLVRNSVVLGGQLGLWCTTPLFLGAVRNLVCSFLFFGPIWNGLKGLLGRDAIPLVFGVEGDRPKWPECRGCGLWVGSRSTGGLSPSGIGGAI